MENEEKSQKTEKVDTLAMTVVVHNMKTITKACILEELFAKTIRHKYPGQNADFCNKSCLSYTAEQPKLITPNDEERYTPPHHHTMLGRDEKGSEAFDKGINDENLKTITTVAKNKIQTPEEDQLFIDKLMFAIKSNIVRYVIIEDSKGEPVKAPEIGIHNEAEPAVNYMGQLKLFINASGAIHNISESKDESSSESSLPGREKFKLTFTNDDEKMGATNYLRPGYGIFKELLVSEIEAPGVSLEDVSVLQDPTSGEDVNKIQIRRNKQITVQGKTIPNLFSGGLHTIRIPKSGWEIVPESRSDWISPKECVEDPEWENKTEECKMVRLDKGILYITQRPDIYLFPSKSSITTGPHRRRRVQYEL